MPKLILTCSYRAHRYIRIHQREWILPFLVTVNTYLSLAKIKVFVWYGHNCRFSELFLLSFWKNEGQINNARGCIQPLGRELLVGLSSFSLFAPVRITRSASILYFSFSDIVKAPSNLVIVLLVSKVSFFFTSS